jgi:hypothetical protein
VKATPPSVEEIKAAIVAEVNRMADEGKPTFGLDGGKVKFHWPDVQEFAPPGSPLVAPSGGATKLACWWDRARLNADAELRSSSLSAAERKQCLTELAAQLARLEHEDESLTEQALAAGIEIHRRPYASAYALLGIEPNTEADAAAAQAQAKAAALAAQSKVERVQPPAVQAAE